MFSFRRSPKPGVSPDSGGGSEKPPPISLGIPTHGAMGQGLPSRVPAVSDSLDDHLPPQLTPPITPQPLHPKTPPSSVPTAPVPVSQAPSLPTQVDVPAESMQGYMDAPVVKVASPMPEPETRREVREVREVRELQPRPSIAVHVPASAEVANANTSVPRIQLKLPPVTSSLSPSGPAAPARPVDLAREVIAPTAVVQPRKAMPGKAATTVPEVYADVRSIPKGLYESFERLDMPATFKEGFALITSSTGKGYLLVAEHMWGSALHLEAGNRIKLKQPDLTITQHRATVEVIRTLHHQNAANVSSHLLDQTEIERFAWKLIDDAVEQSTSDIHIETRDSYAQVFFRIFGERVEQATIASESALALCNVLYGFHADSSSKGTSWNPSKVLDTSIEHETASGTRVQIRFHSAPIHPSPNFHVVCRLLVMDVARTPELEDIGYTNAQVRAIEDMLVGAQGLVVLVGPTNSGKSTSMQALARRIRKNRGESIKLVTVEDPVEYLIEGACQMGVPHGRKQLEDKTGSIYNTLLKGTLRQDPDAVIVGEIRDEESCASVKGLVLAGRKLLSTLHVFESMAVYARLRELGLPESILFMSNFITGVIYQRLVPTLCPHCSLPIEEANQLGLVSPNVFERVTNAVPLELSNIRVRNPAGCPECSERGVIGRTVCAEMIVPDEVFLEHMRAGNLAAARTYWSGNVQLNVNGFGVSAVAHAISKMILGMLDPHDVESQIGMIKVDAPSSTQVSYLAGQAGHSVPIQAKGPRGGMGRQFAAGAAMATNRMADLYEARR